MATAATPTVVLGGGAGAGASPTSAAGWSYKSAMNAAGPVDVLTPVRDSWKAANTATGWLWFILTLISSTAFLIITAGIAAALIYYGVTQEKAACTVPLSTAAITLGALLGGYVVLGYIVRPLLPEGAAEVIATTGCCANVAAGGILIWATVIAFEGDKWARYRRGDNAACSASLYGPIAMLIIGFWAVNAIIFTMQCFVGCGLSVALASAVGRKDKAAAGSGEDHSLLGSKTN